MPCERDHVAAGHPEPVDQDHGQTVIRYGVNRDAGMHRLAVDADLPHRKAAQIRASGLPGTPPSQGIDQNSTGDDPAGRHEDPPQGHTRPSV